MEYKILKCFASIGKIWSTVAIREIKILEMENESQFVKYTTLENNHLFLKRVWPHFGGVLKGGGNGPILRPCTLLRGGFLDGEIFFFIVNH